jgi:hypothetical protein
MINATHTVNPVLALIDSHSGLIMLETARDIKGGTDQELDVAIDKFKRYVQTTRNDLLAYLPEEARIVPSVATQIGKW